MTYIQRILFTILLFSPLSAKADQIFLNNKDRITGSIISMEKSEFVEFQTSFGQTIFIPWSNVTALYDSQNKPIPFSNTSLPKNTNKQEEKLIANNAQTAKKEPNNSKNTHKKEKNTVWRWSGRANLGGSLDDGNANNKAVVFDAAIKVRDERNRFSFGGEVNWEEDEGTETENDQMLFAEYDRFLNDKWFIGLRERLERDKFEQLDLRTKTGLFTGYQFYEGDALNLQARIGADYITEDFETADSEDSAAGSWGLDYDQKFFDAAFQLFHKHELSVPTDDTNAFLFDSESGLRVPVGKHLTGTFQVDFDWDNDPVAGVREEDTSYTLKLGYEW